MLDHPTHLDVTDELVKLTIAAVMAKLCTTDIHITRQDLLDVSELYNIHRTTGIASGWHMRLERKAGMTPGGPYQDRAREILKRLGLEGGK